MLKEIVHGESFENNLFDTFDGTKLYLYESNASIKFNKFK